MASDGKYLTLVWHRNQTWPSGGNCTHGTHANQPFAHGISKQTASKHSCPTLPNAWWSVNLRTVWAFKARISEAPFASTMTTRLDLALSFASYRICGQSVQGILYRRSLGRDYPALQCHRSLQVRHLDMSWALSDSVTFCDLISHHHILLNWDELGDLL